MEASSQRRPVVMLIGDSMGLPRRDVPYGETWPSILKRTHGGIEFVDNLLYAATTRALANRMGVAFPYYSPDVAVLQLGLVDCSPRMFHSWELKAVNTILPRSLSDWFLGRVRALRRRRPGRVRVSPEDYRENLAWFFKCAEEVGSQVITIPIGPVTQEFVEKSPAIEQNVNHYNSILRDLAAQTTNVIVLDPYIDWEVPGEYTADEYHLNRGGHGILAGKISSELRRSLSTFPGTHLGESTEALTTVNSESSDTHNADR